jgi:hypothetical protein
MMNVSKLFRTSAALILPTLALALAGCDREPQIDLVFPLSGPASGGTKMFIIGKNLPGDGQCTFAGGTDAEVSVPATRVNDNELQCETPRFTRFEPVSLRIEKRNKSYGKDISGGFTVYLQPFVQSIQHHVFAKAGGGTTRISISPAGKFLSTATCAFRVFDEYVPGFATVESDQEMTCVAPAIERLGTVFLEISNNGYDYTDDRLEVTIEESAEIHRLDPAEIPVGTEEGDPITVEGGGFTAQTEVKIGEELCRNVQVLSPASLTCVPAPSVEAKTVKVRVKVFPSQGEPHFSAQTVDFTYR